MPRAIEDDNPPIELGLGATSATADESEHGPHAFLYVPDLASETSWSTHRVPERRDERADKRPMGFRR